MSDEKNELEKEAAMQCKVAQLLEEMKNRPPLSIELDLVGKNLHLFSGGAGFDDAIDDRVTVVIGEEDKEGPFALMRVTRVQWHELKQHFDGHFDALEDVRERRKMQ